MTKTVALRRQKLEAEIKTLERKEADTARFVSQRGFIGDTRWQVHRYDADRWFFETVVGDREGAVVFCEKAVTVYNGLR